MSAPGSKTLGQAALDSPVIVRVFLPVTAFRGDGADDVLGVGTHQLHRVHGQVLVQICTALSSIGAQMAFVFSFLWGRNQNCSQKRKKIQELTQRNQ